MAVRFGEESFDAESESGAVFRFGRGQSAGVTTTAKKGTMLCFEVRTKLNLHVSSTLILRALLLSPCTDVPQVAARGAPAVNIFVADGGIGWIFTYARLV